MRTSGLILDLHDDAQGGVLRQLYPSTKDLPEEVKTAHFLSSEEREVLPDDVYALVLVNGQESLRKYACTDRGNTRLNVDYFLHNRHKLPREAQKVAAQNLLQACSWYKLAHKQPELQKVALGLGALVAPAMAALSVGSAASGLTKAVKGGADAARHAGGVINPGLLKGAEASFTPLMPAPSSESGKPASKKAVIRKVGSCLETNETGQSIRSQELVSQSPPKPPEERRGRLITTPKSPGGFMETAERVLHPHIDVTGHDTKVVVQEKAASFALRGKYPLDNLKQVKRAAAYFEEYRVRMPPGDRHEYCVNMTKRASSLGLPLSDEARKYGSVSYAPAEEIAVGLDLRKSAASNPKLNRMLDSLMEKKGSVPPAVFCQTLEMVDRAFGLDHHYDRYVPDPYWTTYGFEKQAEFVETIGNEVITQNQLESFASLHGEGSSARDILLKSFDSDMVEEFCKDPVGIFKSLPREQKLIIMRLATDNAPAGGE